MGFTDNELVDTLPYLRLFAKKLTKRPEDVEDLVNDTVVRALSSRDKFTSGTNLRAWTCFIMRNHFYSSMRRQKFVGETYEGAELDLPAISNLDASIDLQEVLDAMVHLTPKQLSALSIVALGGSYEEAADKLCTELGTVKSLVGRARITLETVLQHEVNHGSV